MSFPEIPMSVMFVVFLLLFLLTGIYPVWKEASAKFKRLMRQRQGGDAPPTASHPKDQTSLPDPAHLDDHERFILRRLAQTPRKGISPRQLAADLHFAPAVITRTLQSLARRGLIGFTRAPLFGVRAKLSLAGERFAREQGYIVRLGPRR